MEAKNTLFYKNRTLNFQGRIVDISTPAVMGILNVTPDSFYAGSKYTLEKELLEKAEQMLVDGATFFDIGGMSTRPGAEIIGVEEELKRVIPAIEAVVKRFPEANISVDTVRAKVAREAVAAGAGMINDISAGAFDDELISAVAELQVPYMLMHMQGQPENMQQDPQYKNVTLEVIDFFSQKIAILKKVGIKDILLDPGFGFGKNLEHNYQLLKEMDQLKIFEMPILAGISRKSMICKLLKVNPEKALNGTTAAHVVALQNGANILRVHDVKEAMEVVKIMKMVS